MGFLSNIGNGLVSVATAGMYNPATGFAKNPQDIIGNHLNGATFGLAGSVKNGMQGGTAPNLLNVGGSPTWQSILDAPGYASLNQQANSPGQSPWALAANAAARQQNTNQLNNASASAAATTGQADANLAARGGLTSGARERNQENGQTNYMSMVQGANNNLNTNMANIATADAQNKDALKQNLLSMQMQDILGKNTFNNKLWAANTNANALTQSAYDQAHTGLNGIFTGIANWL